MMNQKQQQFIKDVSNRIGCVNVHKSSSETIEIYRKNVSGKIIILRTNINYSLLKPCPNQMNRLFPKNDPRAYISDHPPVTGIYKIENIYCKIIVWNVPLNRMVFRNEEGGMLNTSGLYNGSPTGEEFPEDKKRIEFVMKYILFFIKDYDIICLQEICLDVVKILENEGYNVIFTEAYLNSNQGGIATAIKKSNGCIFDEKKIVDKWKSNQKEKSKLFGQRVKLIFCESPPITISNFHLDCKDADYTLKSEYFHECVIESDILLGDFNRNYDYILPYIYGFIDASEQVCPSRKNIDYIFFKSTSVIDENYLKENKFTKINKQWIKGNKITKKDELLLKEKKN
jgi:endonuclease/exonuclease/phosphatase family metal-dependent hydrolase